MDGWIDIWMDGWKDGWNHETRTSSTYCLDNDQTHFKTNFTAHFSNFRKKIQRIVADPKRNIIAVIWFGRLRSQSRSPCPGFWQNDVAIYCALRLPSLGDRDRSPGFG